MAKHADAELMLMLESTAPPVDISRIGIFRAPVAKHEKGAWFSLLRGVVQPTLFLYALVNGSLWLSSVRCKINKWRLRTSTWDKLEKQSGLKTWDLILIVDDTTYHLLEPFSFRAAELMATASHQQLEVKLKGDISVMEEYLEKVQTWGNRQAGLPCVHHPLSCEISKHVLFFVSRGLWTSSTCRTGSPTAGNGLSSSWRSTTAALMLLSAKHMLIYSSGKEVLLVGMGFLVLMMLHLNNLVLVNLVCSGNLSWCIVFDFSQAAPAQDYPHDLGCFVVARSWLG